jgi:MoaA/NifB/PqqE/SkfB family radical SAM enzyme
MGAERIQLPVYRSALSVLPGFERVTQVEGEYLHLDGSDAGARARSFSKEDLEAAAALLPEMLAILGDGIEGGIFFARTRGHVWENQCGSCDFTSVCGKDRRRREERKATDPAVRRFSDLALLDGLGGEE